VFKRRGNKLYYIIISYLHTIYNYNAVIYYINNNNNIQAITNILNIYDCYVTWQTSNDLAFRTLFNYVIVKGCDCLEVLQYAIKVSAQCA
jgi:hypothetical protein